jgi:hypothetical protein
MTSAVAKAMAVDFSNRAVEGNSDGSGLFALCI